MFGKPKEGHRSFCWGQSGRITEEVTFVPVLKGEFEFVGKIRVVMMFQVEKIYVHELLQRPVYLEG